MFDHDTPIIGDTPRSRGPLIQQLAVVAALIGASGIPERGATAGRGVQEIPPTNEEIEHMMRAHQESFENDQRIRAQFRAERVARKKALAEIGRAHV